MSNLKKIVALVLAMALVMTMFASAAIKTDLSKYVDGESFTEAQKDALALVNAVGIINGVGENEIGTASLTRAQLAVVLYAMKNGTTDGAAKYGAPVFTDVPATHWAAGYVSWAALTDVVKGVSATSYAPDTKVTPIQAAAMIARIFDPSACQDPATFAQDAQVAAVKYGLLNGITTPNFFAQSEISRGDMFIMLANALVYNYAKDTNLLTAVFGVEKIEGAILLGAEKTYYRDPYGKNADLAYSVFAFRTETAGDVTYFATDLLCVEDDPTVDDIGCKYVIYVSKTASYNGFRTLYAAYEMEGDKYYGVTTGTVDDGKLVFAGDKQNVFFDNHAIFYVDGVIADVDAFLASYGKANKATYKLIDNDGDGYIEYAFITRYALGDLNAEWITGNVTVYNNGVYTINDTTYKWGGYWNAKKQVYTSDIQATINAFLGTQMPAISSVKYDFLVGDGYIYDVRISEATKFGGSYGVVAKGFDPALLQRLPTIDTAVAAATSGLSMYKGMLYYTFLNEKNEYVSAYVEKVNNTSLKVMLNETQNYSIDLILTNGQLVYFTDWSESGDVCSVYTADYALSDSTYDYNLDTFSVVGKPGNLAYGLTAAVIDPADLSTIDTSNIYVMMMPTVTDAANGSGNYATFTFDGEKYTPDDNGTYYAVPFNDLDLYNSALANETPAQQRYDTVYFSANIGTGTGYVTRVVNGKTVSVFATVDQVEATVSVEVVGVECNEVQLYRANNFWGYRLFGVADNDNIVYKITVGDVTKQIKYDTNTSKWGIVADGYDPATGAFDSAAEIDAAVKELVALLNGAVLDTEISVLTDNIFNQLMTTGYWGNGFVVMTEQRRNLDMSLATIFLYGRLSKESNDKVWRAYTIDTINDNYDVLADKGFLDSNGNVRPTDQVIWTDLKGTKYVKAVAITGEDDAILPSGWIQNEAADLVVFGGMTGKYSAKGWEINTVDKDLNVTASWCNVGTPNLFGDAILAYTDEDGVVDDILAIYESNFIDSLKYIGAGKGTLVINNAVVGKDGKIAVPEKIDGNGNLEALATTIDVAGAKLFVNGNSVSNTYGNLTGKTVTVYSFTAGNVVVVG